MEIEDAIEEYRKKPYISIRNIWLLLCNMNFFNFILQKIKFKGISIENFMCEQLNSS